METGFYIPAGKVREAHQYLSRVVNDWANFYRQLYPYETESERENSVNSLRVIHENMAIAFEELYRNEKHFNGKGKE